MEDEMRKYKGVRSKKEKEIDFFIQPPFSTPSPLKRKRVGVSKEKSYCVVQKAKKTVMIDS